MARFLCSVAVAMTALVTGACGGTAATTAPSALQPALPHQMKGYELYSWQSAGTWNYVLITGTDRTKTVEEITSGPDTVTGDGWVKVSARGVEALKSQLHRLPVNESIFWIGEQTAQRVVAGGPLELPPSAVRDSIAGYCKELGLDLRVMP